MFLDFHYTCISVYNPLLVTPHVNTSTRLYHSLLCFYHFVMLILTRGMVMHSYLKSGDINRTWINSIKQYRVMCLLLCDTRFRKYCLICSLCFYRESSFGSKSCSQVPYLSAGRHPVQRYRNSYFTSAACYERKRVLRLALRYQSVGRHPIRWYRNLLI